MEVIEAQGLTRYYGELLALDHVSFSVGGGEIFGLLGPNGAGKTSLVSLLSTLLAPTEGRAQVLSHDILDEVEEVRRVIGLVFQEMSLDGQLTGWENLEFHARLHGLPRQKRQKRIREVLDLVELADRAGEPVKGYSGGMKRRLEIARALLHSPQVLILDEPTVGLDPQARVHIWRYIQGLSQQAGVTTLLTTHYMEEADHLCRRVAIIDHGRIIALDSPEALKRGLGGDKVVLEVGRPQEAAPLADALRQDDGIKRVEAKGNRVIVIVPDGNHRVPQLIGLADELGITVKGVELHGPTLDDVFMAYTGRKLREADGGMKMRRKMGMMGRM